MVDITFKTISLRKAVATAVVSVSDPDTIDAVILKKVPKGDVFEFARAAGLLGIKKTSDLIPDCHPLPIEYAAITFEVKDMDILIRVEVHTIYKTGVEVEAMHGASITALTMYDMLKPLDKGVSISHIRLEQKTGGKSDRNRETPPDLKVSLVVCSDSVYKGSSEDKAGQAVADKLIKLGLEVATLEVIPDDEEAVESSVKRLTSPDQESLLIYIGGTGLSPRDITPDVLKPLIEREIPGVMETARAYGQDRTPYAMLSRGIAGFIGKTLVLTTPGSTKGASETIDALFPQILHVFKIARGEKH